MPWEAMSKRDLRLEFVTAAVREGANVRLVCRRYGVSAKTGYKWLARFKAEGAAGLEERSRRPGASPRRTDEAVEAAVLAVRAAHPAWGGRKIRRVLERAGGSAAAAPPSPSTITAILRRNGVELGAFGGDGGDWTRFAHDRPNALWQMDFKGHVGLGDGRRLHPLTVLDDHSRFALVLEACADQRTNTVQNALISAFRRYGLPETIITDNGSPWGDGPGSPFTPLGLFLIDQGIRIAHARPYHPQTMGKDERFHRTLKAEALSGPPFADLDAARRALARWRTLYNHERPHEALGLDVPAARYAPSPRSYQERVEPFAYAPGDILRKVQHGGRISFAGRERRGPKCLHGRTIALRPTAQDGRFDLYYRAQFITALDFTDAQDQSQPVTHVSEQVLPMSPV